MSKSPDAFRTISEVAEWLDTPAHVLRFWESRFRQVKPVKRAGGRRYYRPADMALLGGIKRLLHEDGMTIKGVQKILRDKGVKHVADLSMEVDSEIEQSDIDAAEARLMAAIEEPKEKSEIVAAPVAAPEAEAKPEPKSASPAPVAESAPETVATDDTDEAPVVKTSPAPEAVEPAPAPPAEPEPVVEPKEAAPKEDVPPAVEDPVQLDLLAEPSAPTAPEPETKPIEDPAAPMAEDVAEPEEITAKEEPKETKPSPIICDVPDDPTDESLVVDGSADDTALVMLLAADTEDLTGKSTALRALLDRIKGADGKLADGV